MLKILRAVFTLSTIPFLSTATHAADLNFCWVGKGGYTMSGFMQVPDQKMSNAIITEADVTAFKIVGYQGNQPVGSWSLEQKSPNTTWHLRFDPISMTFLTGGVFASTNSQGWNADGAVKNCGNPGFGFNSGNFAQDVCVNGTYIEQSSVAPESPLTATFGPAAAACGQNVPLGKRRFANQ